VSGHDTREHGDVSFSQSVAALSGYGVEGVQPSKKPHRMFGLRLLVRLFDHWFWVDRLLIPRVTRWIVIGTRTVRLPIL